MTKDSPKRKEEGLCHLSASNPLGGEVRAGAQGRNLEPGSEAEAVEEHWLSFQVAQLALCITQACLSRGCMGLPE